MYIYCAICYYTIASIHCTLRHHTILLIRMHTYVHWVVGKREHIPVETIVNLSNRMCVTFNKSICHLYFTTQQPANYSNNIKHISTQASKY